MEIAEGQLGQIPGAVLEQLFRKARWNRSETAERVRQAIDPEYWRGLCPELSLEATRDFSSEHFAIDEQEIESALVSFRRSGYLQLGPLLRPELCQRLKQSTSRLVARGWPAPFLLVYDEPWHVVASPPMLRILRETVGEKGRLSPFRWVFHVRAIRGAHGWPPHVDAMDGRKPRVFTCWFALSAATLDNGCMYVVPRDLVPAEISRQSFPGGNPGPSGALKLDILRHCRALPAQPGELLAWGDDVMHWGSTCFEPGEPRVSFAMVFFDEEPGV